MNKSVNIPVVMTFSTSDPTGGSGIQADIQTLFGMGCHCTTVITAVTAQDTSSVKDFTSTATALVIEQARAILEDIPIAVFKIGMINSLSNLVAIYTLLKEYPDTPVVLHLAPETAGTIDAPNEEMAQAITTLLCPISTLMVLDTESTQILTPGADTLDACAQKLMETGCEYVLIKNCRGLPKTVENSFYGNHRLLETFSWERLPGNYHGAGCTLTAAIAGMLAHKLTPLEAVVEAQKYTWECIKQGYRLGMGSQLPNRLYWKIP